MRRPYFTAGKGERQEDARVQYLHQGIAQRAFKLSFRLDENIEVQGARLENGLLIVDLLRVIPEEQRPRQIPINGSQHRLTEAQPTTGTATT
ncbi:Hsp20 family protein [Salinicola halophyticus]|uniref:Hsp20 family protein n=1 Tax=Salinicola halophyticus TaxID=1808881 RepID=UPI000DA1D3F6|nr:Hsp20 family protein [Salinicola halophyticus]